MGLFSRKSSNVNTTQQTYTQNLNAQSSGGHVVAGEGNRLTVTDAGSIANAFRFADTSQGRSLALVDQSQARAFDFAGDALAESYDFAAESRDSAAALTLELVDRYAESSDAALGKVLEETRAQSKDARDFALTAVKSETRALTEDVIKYGGVGVLLLAALLVLKG